MKKNHLVLNEQIERLRELIRKCYGAVAGKNGLVPEVGERNMENLPAAIGSIKSASDIPKIKVSSVKVANNCINEEGRWEGDVLIDDEYITSLMQAFQNLRATFKFLESWKLPNVEQLYVVFSGATSLDESLDLRNWDVSKCTDFRQTFTNFGVNKLNLEGWDVSKGTNFLNLFYGSSVRWLNIIGWNVNQTAAVNSILQNMTNCETLIGDMTIDEVIMGNVSILGLTKSTDLTVYWTTIDKLNRASLRALINGLADLTGQASQTLTIGTGLIAKLTKEDIAIAVNKNWTIA